MKDVFKYICMVVKTFFRNFFNKEWYIASLQLGNNLSHLAIISALPDQYKHMAIICSTIFLIIIIRLTGK